MSKVSEDERLSQMIKDYIELGSTITSSFFGPRSDQSLDHVDDNPMHFSLQEIMEEIPDAEVEVYGKILFYLKDVNESMDKHKLKLKKLKKWIVFRLEMDNYEAHLCQTSWSTPFGPPSVFQFQGDYEYVDVIMRDKISQEAARIIVDIDFRTQFELARPTATYQELTNALPLIFVGTQEKLEKLISLICSAAKQSLRERGLHVPPWRKASYMKSKWLSNHCKKVSFSEYSGKYPENGCFLDFLQVQEMGTF